MSSSAPSTDQPTPSHRPVRELARLFLKLGTIAFGGPAAHVAMMEDEVVRRRQWLSRQEFLDMLGATNLIPGPNSTEMAIHIGYQRAGMTGLIVAGACFILPAVVIVAFLAFLYVHYGQLPISAAILNGIKPVIIAIVAQAIWRLAPAALRTRWLILLGVLSAIAAFAGINELLVLLGAALAATGKLFLTRPASTTTLPMLAAPLPLTTLGTSPGLAETATTIAASSSILLPLFLIFLKIGSVLFGGGYVLLAFLQSDLVDRMNWLTQAQLLDAVAVGQVTPGPLFTTATFIGYVLAGPQGAAVATIGIFLPAFIFVAISAPIIPRLRRSPFAGAMLDGLNAASLALMAVVTVQLARSAVHDIFSSAIAVASAILLLKWRLNATWLIAGGALAGPVIAWLGK